MSLKVLIGEEETPIANRLKEIVRSAGVGQIHIAPNRMELARMPEVHGYDIIFTDTMEEEAFGAIKRIRSSNGEHKDVPIYVLGPHYQEDDAKEAGATGFIDIKEQSDKIPKIIEKYKQK